MLFMELPWIEKYRPKTIEDLIIDENSHNKISKIIELKDMPNIIITGIPGIGKTTTIMCISKMLLGKYFKNGVLELNASDDRGIKSVQDLISNFCKKRLTIKEDEKDKYAHHKIILLDEADNMTKKAQHLINNLMETHQKTTRFAFTCNNSSDIIEAIQSKCMIFRYRRLSIKQVKKRVLDICEKENIIYDKAGVNGIVSTSNGDMRQALNNLQLTYNGYSTVTEETVFKSCDKPHPTSIRHILHLCNNKKYKNAIKETIKLRNNGFSCLDIVISFQNTLKTSDLKINETTKNEFMKIISNTHISLSRGVDTLLQLTGCIADMSMVNV